MSPVHLVPPDRRSSADGHRGGARTGLALVRPSAGPGADSDDGTASGSAGTAVAVKVHADPATAAAEAARLRAAAHPGVVELVAVEPTEAGTEIHTAWAGRPLDAVPVPGASEAGRLVAALAATVADLHEAGVVHGHITADHVLVDAASGPRLCGFGAHDGGHGTAGDVAALGGLLGALLDRARTEGPTPADVAGARLSRRRDHAFDALAALAAQATADPATRRPSARRLAAELAAVVTPTEPAHPGRGRGRTAGAGPAHPRHRRRRARRWTDLPTSAAVGGALATLALIAIVVVRYGDPAPAAPRDCPGERAGAVRVDLDGDGCGEAVQVHGNVVRVGSRAWRVGSPGDEVELGDWDCDGSVTPAVLRHRTGEVFVFTSWPDERATVEAGRTVPGARSAHVETDGACDVLVISDGADGSDQ